VEARAGAGVLEGHEEGVAAVAVSPDGRHALSGGIDGMLRTWDLRLRRPLRAWKGHESEVTTVAFLPDGRHAVSAGRDKVVRLWDLTSGKAVRTLPHTGAVLSAAALPSGNGLLCGGTDLALTQWRLDWEADERAAQETLAPAHGATVRMDAGSAWEEIQRAAPRAAAREVAVHAARSARRKLPSAKVVGLAALLLLAVAGAAVMMWPRRVVLGLSEHQAKRSRTELANDVVALQASESCPDGGYDEYLQRARERVVGEDTLGCLLAHQQPGVVDAYLRDFSFADSEFRVAERRRRNAVSFLAALGEPGVPSVCQWLRSPDAAVRDVAVSAVAAVGGAAAVECVGAALRDVDPAVRIAAARGLRLLTAKGALDAAGAWPQARALAADPDPTVRVASVAALAAFDFEHASQAIGALAADGDARVAAEAKGTLEVLKKYKNLNPDLPY
jgi:hypothetical protein